MTKNELKRKVEEILDQKQIAKKAKKNLLDSFLFWYDHYQSYPYLNQTKTEYIEEYLEVLKKLRGYMLIDLENLNVDHEVISVFQKAIVEVENQQGNLDYINGNYIPVEHGSYVCLCKGLAWNCEKIMFTLEEGNSEEKWITIHHEMTHLQEGKNPFLCQHIPLQKEVRKMFQEGRAVTREANILCTDLQDSNVKVQREVISDATSSFEIYSQQYYPLYGKLYQTLQFIFGIETLEQYAKNDISDFDMFQDLKQNFKELPVETIFAHLIYIISCYENIEKKELKKAIIHVYDYIDLKKIYLSMELEKVKNQIEEVEPYQLVQQDFKNKPKEIVVLEEYRQRLSTILQQMENLEQSRFCSILEEVCLKNPSLKTSFDFLDTLVFQKVQEEYVNATDDIKDIYLSKLEHAFYLRGFTIMIDHKKTSLTF